MMPTPPDTTDAAPRRGPRSAGAVVRRQALLIFLIPWVLPGCAPAEDAARAEIARDLTTLNEQAWGRGDVGVFDSLMADSIVFHYHGTPRTMSRKDMAAAVLRWREGLSGLRMETEELVVEGDLAAARLRLSGIHDGPLQGAEPTGTRVEMALMTFFRFEDGRVVEMWEADDQVGLRRQLGPEP